MNFGIFSSSRGGNPQQSETNLNQKTPETLLLPGPLPSLPKIKELEHERVWAYSLAVNPFALMQRRGLVIGLVERRTLH